MLWGPGGLSLGKAYEITYVRLKFHTSRPESFAIYKRGRADGPWVPFQYYSASCLKTYGKQPRHYLRPGEDEQVAFCTDEFSDISPLSGGNVAFSTLEGRPSAYNFDGSPALQVLGGGRGVGVGSPGFGGGESVLFCAPRMGGVLGETWLGWGVGGPDPSPRHLPHVPCRSG